MTHAEVMLLIKQMYEDSYIGTDICEAAKRTQNHQEENENYLNQKRKDLFRDVECIIFNNRLPYEFENFAQTNVFDMKIIYYIRNAKNKLIHKDLLKQLHISEYDLYFNALYNLKKRIGLNVNVVDVGESYLYCLDSDAGNGSIGILYTDLLSEIADREDSDLYLVPLNTELTIIVNTKNNDFDEVKYIRDNSDKFFKEFNSEKFGKDIYLTNKIFKFSKSDNKLYEVANCWTLKSF